MERLVVIGLVVVICASAPVRAVFPFIIDETGVPFGQCFDDSDCDIILAMPNSSIECNENIGRCVDSMGSPLAPVLNEPCPDLSFVTRVWPSILTQADGIVDQLIKVEFPPALPGMRTVRGSLRIYQLPAGSPETTIDETGFIRQQVVNYPCRDYYFRNLAPLVNVLFVYRVAYFDFLGCTLQMDVGMEVADPMVAPNLRAAVPSLGMVDFTRYAPPLHPGLEIVVSEYGRRVQFGVPEDVWVNVVQDDLTGPRRVLVAQVFDQGGGVLQTVVGQDLYIDVNNPEEGLLFPPFTDSFTFSNFEGPSSLSGRVSFRAVMAYSFVPFGSGDPDADRVLLMDANGVVEGLELWTFGWPDTNILSLTVNSTLPPFPPPYAPNAGYRQNDGIILTTSYPSTANPNVFNTLDFSKVPAVTFKAANTNQMASLPQFCPNATSNRMEVTLDYSAFQFNIFFMPATARLVRINTTTSFMEEIPASATVPVLLDVTFEISQTGFYCALLDIDLLDGNLFVPPIIGPRRFLKTCFQVPGRMTADAVHVTSRFNSLTNPADQTGQFINAGVFTNVDTDWIITLPAIIVVNELDTINIKMIRNPESMLQMEIVEFFDAEEYNVFENPNTMSFDLEFWYAEETPAPAGPYRIYWLRRSVFHDVFYRLMRPAATLFPEEVATLSFQLGFNETLGAIPNNTFVDYACDTMFMLKNLVAPDIEVRINVEDPICPNERAIMFANIAGSFAFHLDNPVYETDFGAPAPYQNPLAYYVRWYNAQQGNVGNGNLLSADLGNTRFAAPSNIDIRVEAVANNGAVATAVARATSIIPENATMVSFLPQEPVCINGTQFVRLSYVIGGIATEGIVYWQPLDVYAEELYNPNVPFFDIPSDCGLFALNWTAFEVYEFCQAPGAPGANTTACMGCMHLPIARPEVVGNDLITGGDDTFWEVVAWIPTEFFNNATGRFIYCRSASSIRARVPRPTSLIFSNLRRVLIEPPGMAAFPCQGAACFAVNIQPDVDSFFAATYENLVMVVPSPPFLNIPNAASNGDPIVELATPYEMLVFLDDVLCPAIVPYVPLPRGPVGLVADASRSTCGDASAKVNMYVAYNDPDEDVFGTERDVCLFWPYRDVPEPQVSTLQTFFSFRLPVNAPLPTIIPYAPDFLPEDPDDPTDLRFMTVRGGLQRVMFYDRCVSGNCGNVDCSTLVANQETFQLTNPNLAFHIFEFNVTEFTNAAGGIRLEQTRFVEAQCYGDTYEISYTVFDDRGPNDIGYPPYEVFFFEPVTGALLAQSPICVGDPPTGGVPQDFYVNIIEGNIVQLFTFNITIETGPMFGFRPSGNYTLQVRSCTSTCIATFATFIQMPDPIDIVLTATPSSCAFTPGGLIPAIAGGIPGPSGQFYNLPGSNITREAFYLQEWITPFNPTQYLPTILGIRQNPGNYSLRVTDARGCQAVKNVTVPSPVPIQAEVVGFEGVCDDSIQGTFQIRAWGGVPPLRLLEGLTQITMGQDISFEFVAALNQTIDIHIIDSVGCIMPMGVDFEIPNPGPLPITLTTTASCPNFADGTAIADIPGGVGVTCAWTANGVDVPVLQVCSLENLPGGTFVRVVATDIIGCSAVATAEVPMRPPIVISEPVPRTTNGVFGGPCIDVITIGITGGQFGPPYIVTLFNDFTNATLNYAGGNNATVTNVCRSVQYTIFVRDTDNRCPQGFVSVDPEFGFGTGQDESPLGLPFNDVPIFGEGFNQGGAPKEKLRIELAAVLFAGFVLIVIIILVVVLTRSRTPKSDDERTREFDAGSSFF